MAYRNALLNKRGKVLVTNESETNDSIVFDVSDVTGRTWFRKLFGWLPFVASSKKVVAKTAVSVNDLGVAEWSVLRPDRDLRRCDQLEVVIR